MIRFFYKFIGLIYTSFIIFLFLVNYNMIGYNVNIVKRVYFSIKINLIYYIFYFIYVVLYFKYLHKKNNTLFTN